MAGSRGWYSPRWHYEHEPETRAALDLIFSDHFSRHEPGVFSPLQETLLTGGDHYMHLAEPRRCASGSSENPGRGGRGRTAGGRGAHGGGARLERL